jgi:creatinine amidohydrolase
MRPKSVFLVELSNLDVEEFLMNGGDMVIIPVGALEQHGAHAPLSTDVLIPQEIARRVALSRNAVVAPPVNYGLSAAHKGFPGAAYISVNTFLGVVADLCRSFADAGFRKIVFINGHYTNTGPLTMACYDVSKELPEDTQAYQITYWEALPPEELEEYLSLKAGLHANIGETSAVMAINPSLVDLEKAQDYWPDFPDFEASPNPALTAYFETQVSANLQALPHGTWGEPSKSSVEKGEEFLQQIEKAVLRLIREVELMHSKLGTPPKHVTVIRSKK